MDRSRRPVVLRPRADLDIEQQFEYLAIEANVATARRFLEALEQSCRELAQHPKLGSPRTFGDPRLEGLRFLPVRGFRRHLIFYIARVETLEIIRVLHAARDIESLLRR